MIALESTQYDWILAKEKESGAFRKHIDNICEHADHYGIQYDYLELLIDSDYRKRICDKILEAIPNETAEEVLLNNQLKGDIQCQTRK